MRQKVPPSFGAMLLQAHLRCCFAAFLVCSLYFGLSLADEATHRYADQEGVSVWVSKTGPKYNPHETYSFAALPICEAEGLEKAPRSMTIGEALSGHALIQLERLQVRFGAESPPKTLCNSTLTRATTTQLADMIMNDYWVQYFVDGLPAYVYLGVKMQAAEGQVPALYTHKGFRLARNKDQIVSVDIYSGNPVALTSATKEVAFTYDVQWMDSTVPFSHRYDRYYQESFFEQRIHWFNILNSAILALSFCGVVVYILLRTLKNDIARYALSEIDELESLDRLDDGGWKQIHGDVFRRPRNITLFSVVFSAGCQLLILTLAVLAWGSLSGYYSHRGATASAVFACYIVTQLVAGYAGGYVHRYYGGTRRRRVYFIQSASLPALVALLLGPAHLLAKFWGTSTALPAGKFFLIVVLVVFFCFPLHYVGAALGYRRARRASPPCRTHQLQRPIPAKSSWLLPTLHLVGGLSGFGCLFIEMHFLFSTVWNYGHYHFYGFLLMAILITNSVQVCASITVTYVLLNTEDYRWAWNAMTTCATSALFLCIYCIYYYSINTHMSGLLQFAFYFGTAGCLCASIGLISAAIAYMGASAFVHLIYRSIKLD